MKILFIHRDLPPDSFTGVAIQVHRLAETLMKQGHQVDVLTFSAGPPDKSYRVIPMQLLWPRHPFVQFIFNRLKRFTIPLAYKKFSYVGYDVVHIHGDGGLLNYQPHFVRTFYGTAKLEGRHSATLKGRAAQTWSYYLERRENRQCRRAGIAIGISPHIGKYLTSISRTIPCLAPSGTTSDKGKKSQRPSILFMGSVHSRKRGDWAIDLAIAIWETKPDVRFQFVSQDPVKDREYFEQHRTDPSQEIEFHHRLSPFDLGRLFQSSWIYLSLSSYEGFGVSLIEAFANRCLVVTARNPGSQTIVHSPELGFFVDERTAIGVLLKIISTYSSFEAILENGFRESLKYTPDTIASAYQTVYQMAANAKTEALC